MNALKHASSLRSKRFLILKGGALLPFFVADICQGISKDLTKRTDILTE